MKTISVLSMLIILSIWISPACSIPIGAAKGEAQTQQLSALPSEQSLQATIPSSQAQTPTPPGDANVILAGAQPTDSSKPTAIVYGDINPANPTTSSISFDNYYVNYLDDSKPVIYCYHVKGPGQWDLVGEIDFYPDNSTPPPDASENSYIRINYPISQFNDVMNMLRYTKGTTLALQLGVGLGGDKAGGLLYHTMIQVGMT